MNHRAISLLVGLVLVTALLVVGVAWQWPEDRTVDTATQSLEPSATTSPLDRVRVATSSILQALPSPAVGPPDADAAAGEAFAAPTIIAVNERTAVTVTIQITDSKLIAGSVNLQRLDASGKVVAILGTLKDSGTGGDAVAGDKTFTLRRSFVEGTTTPVRLRVSWALRAVLRRPISNTVTIEVWQFFSELGFGLSYPPTLVANPGEPAPDSTQAVDFVDPNHPGTGFSITCAPTNTGLLDLVTWADAQQWPFPDDWRNHLQVGIAGRIPILTDLTSTVIFRTGARICNITNGIGQDGIPLDAETFRSIASHLRVVGP